MKMKKYWVLFSKALHTWAVFPWQFFLTSLLITDVWQHLLQAWTMNGVPVLRNNFIQLVWSNEHVDVQVQHNYLTRKAWQPCTLTNVSLKDGMLWCAHEQIRLVKKNGQSVSVYKRYTVGYFTTWKLKW